MALLLLSLLSSVLLARLLGPDGLGLFALVLLLPELARSFGMLGFDQANTVYAGLEPERRRALVWQSAVAAAVLGGGAAAAGMTYLALDGPGASRLLHGPLWLYLIPLATVPACQAAACWGAVLRGANRITLINGLDVGFKVGALVLTVILVALLRLDIAGAVWADAMVKVGSALVLVFFLHREALWGRPVFDWALWNRTTRFAVPAHLVAIMSYLNYRLDQFIIAALLPAEQLGYYVTAVALAERLWLLTGAVAGPLLPHLTNTPGRDPATAAVVARHVLVWTLGGC